MQRRLLTTAILITALVLYGAGMAGGASLLFATGFACEFWFWARARMPARRRHA